MFRQWKVFLISGICSPIFAEIIPEKSRTSIYALDNSFESILASVAPPIVGILAQLVFGYKPIPEGSSDSIETDRENAASLAEALYTAIGIPMAICCFIYSFLYCTYPRDRETARMQALIDSELQDTEENVCLSSCGEPGFHVVNSKKLDDEERSESYIEFGGEKRLDFDNNDDKKSLLHHDQSSSSA